MNRAIQVITVLAVAAVAAVAGWISYRHAVEVVTAHGEPGMVGKLYPACIDGLIVAASMVLLDAARRDVPAPSLARTLLAAGIGATLFANVYAGIAFGVLGACVAAWPALALVGSYELLMLLVRAQAVTEPPEPAQGQPEPDGPQGFRVPRGDKLAKLFRSDLEQGKIPGRDKIKATAHVGYPRAVEIQSHLSEVLNGNASQNGREPESPREDHLCRRTSTDSARKSSIWQAGELTRRSFRSTTRASSRASWS
jgi:hypothetical protein